MIVKMKEDKKDYLQNVDENPYFSDYDGSGGEYESEPDIDQQSEQYEEDIPDKGFISK